MTYRGIYAHTVLMWMNKSGFVVIVAVVENHKTWNTERKKKKRVVAGISSCPYHLAIVAVVAV